MIAAPEVQPYRPIDRHGVCMPTTTHGIPSARADRMARRVQRYRASPVR